MLHTHCYLRALFFVSGLLFFSTISFAAPGHVYLGSSLGMSSATLSLRTPTISYTSGVLITDAYPLNDRDKTAAIFSINGGYEFSVGQGFPHIMLGAGVYRNLSDYTYTGRLTESVAGAGSATLYKYAYHLNSTRVMGEMQLNWQLGRILPFINVGIGSAWNHSDHYKETANTPMGYVALPPFKSQTNTQLAYQLGVGLSMAFNFLNTDADFCHERVSIGYRYVNSGKTALQARGEVYPYKLKTGRLASNELYLNFTHLF